MHDGDGHLINSRHVGGRWPVCGARWGKGAIVFYFQMRFSWYTQIYVITFPSPVFLLVNNDLPV